MRATIILSAVVLFGGGALSSGEKAGDVQLKVVKYDGLKDVIHKNRGKVIYLDFWNNL